MDQFQKKFDCKHYFTNTGSIDRKRGIPNYANDWIMDKKGRMRNNKLIGKEKEKEINVKIFILNFLIHIFANTENNIVHNQIHYWYK